MKEKPFEKIMDYLRESVEGFVCAAESKHCGLESPIEEIFLTALLVVAKWQAIEDGFAHVLVRPVGSSVDAFTVDNQRDLVVYPQTQINNHRVDFLISAYCSVDDRWHGLVIEVGLDPTIARLNQRLWGLPV